MVNAQNTKLVSITRPAAAVNNAAVTTTAVDTRGWDYCQIVLNLGATDVALTVLKVQESDDNSTYTDVTGLDFDGDTDIDGNTAALPSATDDNKFFVFDVNMKGRKRYLDLSATIGAGTTGAFVSAFAVLSRGDEAPDSSSERGAGRVLRV